MCEELPARSRLVLHFSRARMGCALKSTGINLELLSDYDMILMIKQGIRGGIFQISNRYGKANNKYLSDNKFDRDNPSTFVTYLDANSLYGWAMSKPLPTSGFKWVSHDELNNWRRISCILEVDLEYPEKLHDLHNDYPLAPESIILANTDVAKLIPNLNDKKKYVLHYENLKLYESLGLNIVKIHRGIKFEESAWLKKYIDLNTDLRTRATNEFEKDFFKLMNNSVFGKTLENLENHVDIKLVCDEKEAIKLSARLSYTNNLLSANQHGFTRNRSCLTNLLETLEEWTEALDEGCGVDAIFLDYQKAFDTVPHQRLLSKLKGYGISVMLLEWIRNFLMYRKMRVVINGEETNWAAVLSGVPQGSVLGPLLFLIYVNELPDIIESSVRMFADDTKLWRKIQNEEDEQILQQDLDRLENWSETWLLKFNASKCKVMQIGRKRNVNYHLRSGMDIVNLTETEMEKDLGVWIDKDLKWSHQCRKAASKAMSVLG